LFPGLVRRALSRRGAAFFGPHEQVDESLPLSLIDGIDDDTIDRLSEMGISDIQHLATVDPIEFLLKAGYPPMRVLDWIDQAMLVTYVRRRITATRVYGIRGAIDFAVLYLDYRPTLKQAPADDQKAARARGVLAALAIRMEMSPDVLLQIGRALWEDDNVHFVWLLWMNRVFWDLDLDAAGDDDGGADDGGGGGGGGGGGSPTVPPDSSLNVEPRKEGKHAEADAASEAEAQAEAAPGEAIETSIEGDARSLKKGKPS
jgi:hypothetical protein